MQILILLNIVLAGGALVLSQSPDALRYIAAKLSGRALYVVLLNAEKKRLQIEAAEYEDHVLKNLENGRLS